MASAELAAQVNLKSAHKLKASIRGVRKYMAVFFHRSGQYYMKIDAAIKPIEIGNFTGAFLPGKLLAWSSGRADDTLKVIEIPDGCVTRQIAIG